MQTQSAVQRSLSPDYVPAFLFMSSFKELLTQKESFHILILDLNMDNHRSIEIVEKFVRIHPDCHIFLVTDYQPHVTHAYRISHDCLLLKNHMQEFPFFLRKAVKEAMQHAGKYLNVHIQRHIYQILMENVLYLERQGHATYVHQTNGQTIRSRDKVDDLIRAAGNPRLIRCHVSYAVNLDQVKRKEKELFVLADNTIIPISRTNQTIVQAIFNSYKHDKIV